MSESSVTAVDVGFGFIGAWVGIWTVLHWGTVWSLANSFEAPYALLAKGIAIILGVTGVCALLGAALVVVLILFTIFAALAEATA